MIIKRIYIVVFMLMFLVVGVVAQEEESDELNSDKIFWGGNLGLGFGTETIIDISPYIGYRFKPNLHAGAGITYMYYKYQKFSTSIYGARVFSRFFPIDQFFIHAELEVLSLESDDFSHPTSSKRFDVENVMIGGGYMQAIGENTYTYIVLLYNLNETVYSPYTNPIIRFGFIF